MTRKPKFSIETISELGTEKLASILFDHAQNDRLLKQKLSLELSAEDGANAVAKDIRRKLSSIDRSHEFIKWRDMKNFAITLEQQRSAIVEMVGPKVPTLALDLLWQLLDLHESVIERVDDRNGNVGEFFRSACHDAAVLAEIADTDPESLADLIFSKITNNGYGVYDDIITNFASVLGTSGFAKLKSLLHEHVDVHLSENTEKDNSHQIYNFRVSGAKYYLREIADCEGDVDAFIETYGEKELENAKSASDISARLVAANRAEEALAYLDNADPKKTGHIFGEEEWNSQRIECFDALGRSEEAQALRIAEFQKNLNAHHLKRYLKNLPEFDDVEAEDAALEHAVTYPSIHTALRFLTNWPALEHASRLVLSRPQELDGNQYYLLSPAAELIEGQYPLAAVVLRRALIDEALDNGKSGRYGHTARHILENESLDAQITDYGDFETHADFMSRIKSQHARKTSFWSRLPE